jgi:hypothetical protein
MGDIACASMNKAEKYEQLTAVQQNLFTHDFYSYINQQAIQLCFSLRSQRLFLHLFNSW